MADNKNDLQAITASALGGVPSFLKSGLASNLKVVQAAPETAYDGHRAIASIADNDPNTLRIHEAELFRKATPAQRTALLSHELTHRQMDQAPPGLKFAAINPSDPYSYDENNLNRPISNFSGEQLARMVETNTAYQNDPTISAGRKAQVAAQYAPIIAQLQKLPQATINTQQPADNTINTTANAPAGVQFDAAPLVQPVEAGPTHDQSDWEDVPQKGSGVQSSDADWEDISAPTPAEVNQHNLREGFKGAGKLVLGAIVGDPSVASINPLVHARQNANDAELSGDLQSDNGEQSAGKLAAGGAGLLLGAGRETVDSIPGAIKSLTTAGKARMGTLLDSNISSALHTDLGATLSKVAKDAGVEIEPTSDVRKVVGNVATAIREKAQSKLDEVDELFKGLSDDDAPAGLEHYSDIQNAITKKEKDLNMLRSSTPAKPSITTATSDAVTSAQKAENKAANLRTEIAALKGQKATADAALDAQGLQGARQQADALFEQADALDKLRKAHAKSTFGAPGSGQTNPVKFHEQLGDLHDSGDLHTALGEHSAQDIMDATGRASRLMQRNAKVKGNLVKGAAIAGLGSGTVGTIAHFIQ